MLWTLLAAVLAVAPPPPNAGFDYQIGGDYDPPAGVTVVTRDWFAGSAPDGGYGVCYVNAFQTQDDERGVARPDERSAWPRRLVLSGLGDDPNWDGEYLVDISTAPKRRAAARWVQPMIATCAQKGFRAVEYDNLDSWTRLDAVPFGRRAALAYAADLTRRAHALGLAVAQKNTPQLTRRQARRAGFDFAVAEECGRYRECGAYRRLYGDHVLAIEYGDRGFRRACDAVGDRVSVVRRDVGVSRPGAAAYRFAAC
jgi:hypothetical protein